MISTASRTASSGRDGGLRNKGAPLEFRLLRNSRARNDSGWRVRAGQSGSSQARRCELLKFRMSITANLHDSREAAPTPLGVGAAARFIRDSPFLRVAAAIALDVLGSSRRSDPATHVKNGHVPECHRLAPAS